MAAILCRRAQYGAGCSPERQPGRPEAEDGTAEAPAAPGASGEDIGRARRVDGFLGRCGRQRSRRWQRSSRLQVRECDSPRVTLTYLAFLCRCADAGLLPKGDDLHGVLDEMEGRTDDVTTPVGCCRIDQAWGGAPSAPPGLPVTLVFALRGRKRKTQAGRGTGASGSGMRVTQTPGKVHTRGSNAGERAGPSRGEGGSRKGQPPETWEQVQVYNGSDSRRSTASGCSIERRSAGTSARS